MSAAATPESIAAEFAEAGCDCFACKGARVDAVKVITAYGDSRASEARREAMEAAGKIMGDLVHLTEGFMLDYEPDEPFAKAHAAADAFVRALADKGGV